MKFNTESPVFQFLGTFFDFVILNMVFLITCMPIVTIGPALCALYTVTLQEARGEHGYMIKPYLEAFKQNFKNGVILFLIYFAVGMILLFNLTFWLHLRGMAGNIALAIVTICTILYVFSLLFVFALSARFENTIKQTMINSILIPLANLKQTGLLVVIAFLGVTLSCFTSFMRIFLIIFGFAFFAYCASFPITKVFEKYEPDEPETSSDEVIMKEAVQ